jgi:hypothetical protein
LEVWSEQALKELAMAILPSCKTFGMPYINEKSEDKDEDKVYSLEISDKKDRADEATRVVNVFRKGFICWARRMGSYDDWCALRSKIVLDILEKGNIDDVGLIGAIDAHISVNVPDEKIVDDWHERLLGRVSPIISAIPIKDPSLLDLGLTLKEGMYRFHFFVDSELRVDRKQYIAFSFVFPVLEMPTSGELKSIIEAHFEKVDSWGPETARTLVSPLLRS